MQKKPPTSSSDSSNLHTDAGFPPQADQGKKFDPFAPPYNPNLYVSDLRDKDNEEDYVVLVSLYQIETQPDPHRSIVKQILRSATALPPRFEGYKPQYMRKEWLTTSGVYRI